MRVSSAWLLLLVLATPACMRQAAPDPTVGDPWLDVAVALDHTIVHDADLDATALIELAALDAPGDRVPARLALVLDASGSMEGNKIEQLRLAAHGLVDALDDGDELTIVTYADAATPVLAGWRAGRDRAEAHEAIDAIEPAGQTCLSCGLQQAYDLLAQQRQLAATRVLVLSDGHANRGIVDAAALGQFVASARDRGIDTATIGLGRLHDEVRLATIADTGRGRYSFLASADELDGLLQAEVDELHRLAVADVVVQVRPGDGVVLGQTQHPGAWRNGDDWMLPVGQLSVGDGRQLVVPLTLPAGDMGRAVRVSVTFADPQGERYLVEQDAWLTRTPDEAVAAASHDPRVDKAASLLFAALVTEQAMDAYASGNTEAAVALLEEGAAALGAAAPADAMDVELEEERATLEALQTVVTTAAPESNVGRGNALNQRARARERVSGRPAEQSRHPAAVRSYDELE